MKSVLFVVIFSILSFAVYSQNEIITDTTEAKLIEIEKLKYKQQPGLALAASKIFFSDRRYSISGFGEFNSVPLQTGANRNAGDIELYYTGLYRYATFFGYRITNKLIWNSEFQIEFLHDRDQETHAEVVLEAFVDYLYKDYLKVRLGFFPLTIGYVNNNDEPVMFYSVNRAEVERLIIPTTWIEFGTMFYGSLGQNWSYALGVTQGLNASNYIDGTWIRQGREIRLDVPKTIALNPQINYEGIENLTLSASGYFGNSGQGNEVLTDEGMQQVDARIDLGSAFAKYDWKDFRFVAVGTYGRLSDTEKIFVLTQDENGEGGQVMGESVYGYLFELGWDILPLLRKGKTISDRKNRFVDYRKMKLPVFARFERLNTHYSVNNQLLMYSGSTTQKDLRILTAGINFNTHENIVLKGNYQYRINGYEGDINPINHVIEFGVGFIF
jgi:hypothetical protein